MAVTLVSFFVSIYSTVVPSKFSEFKHSWKYGVAWHIYITQLVNARFTFTFHYQLMHLLIKNTFTVHI